MKNFTKTIASIGLSLVAIGAMAQMQAHYSPTQRPTSKPHVLVNPAKSSSSAASTQRVAANTINGFLDYVDGDQLNNGYMFWNGSSGNYTAWSPVLYMNSKYTIADTVTSPFTSNSANVYTANSFTVAYDTMWDNFQQSFRTVGAGSLTIDTLWCILGYHNTSNQNDTLIFTFCQVTSRGMPTGTVIAIDTQVIPPHQPGVLPGTSLDSNFFVGFIPAGGPISGGTMGGWHFCVNVTVHGSKSDTLGFEYYSAFTQCNAGAYSDSCTTMGVRNGICPATNSFVSGLYWFNSAAFGGNGSQLTLPVAAPATGAGKWVNSGGQQFYNFTPGGCSGFIFWPGIQNIGLMLSVTYNDNTGVNEVAANADFSINQNYPNPFNQNTVINYSLTKESNVIFTVYDMTGRELMNNTYSKLSSGKHSVELNANQFTPGIYLYTFNVNGVKVTKRMVITQ